MKFEGSAKQNNTCVSKQVSQGYSIEESSFHILKQIFRYQSVPNYSQKWKNIHFDARTLQPENTNKNFIKHHKLNKKKTTPLPLTMVPSRNLERTLC